MEVIHSSMKVLCLFSLQPFLRHLYPECVYYLYNFHIEEVWRFVLIGLCALKEYAVYVKIHVSSMYQNVTGFPLTLFEYQTTTLQEGYVSEHQAVEDAQFGHWHKLATSHVVLAQAERLLACTFEFPNVLGIRYNT
jgi:hypothetical protein